MPRTSFEVSVSHKLQGNMSKKSETVLEGDKSLSRHKVICTEYPFSFKVEVGVLQLKPS